MVFKIIRILSRRRSAILLTCTLLQKREIDEWVNICHIFGMLDTYTLKEITKGALNLSKRQRLVLANLLLEVDEAGEEVVSDRTWEAELQDRIRAIDEGSVEGLPYQNVMEEAARVIQS